MRSGRGLIAACALALTVAPGSAGAAALPAETVKARQHFFGTENVAADGSVRADRVIMSWFSVASFATAIDGHVILLDAYIHKSEDQPNYVPTTTDELVALKPEAIFLGHGHFDHGLDGGQIIARTGAFLVGTPEHCDQAKQQAADYAGKAVDVRCLDAVTRGSEPGKEVRQLRPFGDRLEVTALKHLHSAAEAPDGENHESSVGPGAFPDSRQILLHPPGPSVVGGLSTSGDEGSSILYRFKLGDLSLIWNDTAGPLRERGPHLFDVLKGLPATDIEVGSVLGFNDPTNGLRDIVDYVQMLKPKLFFPNHHDFVAEYGTSQRIEGVMRREMAKRGELPTEVRWLYDPLDYLRPGLMTFDPADPRWADGATACLPARAGVRAKAIAGVRLGSRGTGRLRRSCVTGGGAVSAVYADGRAVLVATTARGHGNRGVRPGSANALVRRAFRQRRRIGRGLYLATPRSRMVIGTRGARVRFVAVADRRLLRSEKAVRKYLRYAGLG